MNEENIYSEMLEIPVNTCNITYTPPTKRKRKKKDAPKENVKELAIEKANREFEEQAAAPAEESAAAEEVVRAESEQAEETDLQSKPKRKFKVSVIGVQLAVVVLLLGVIVFSNLFMEQSGIAVFFNSIFAPQAEQTDDRAYNSFTPALPTDGDVTVADGVMSFAVKGSVYSPCDGTITALTQGEDGKYVFEITHSEKFKTVIKGVDYAYQELGSTVYGNIPLGYSLGENVELCFYGEDGQLITSYTVDNETDTVVWEV